MMSLSYFPAVFNMDKELVNDNALSERIRQVFDNLHVSEEQFGELLSCNGIPTSQTTINKWWNTTKNGKAKIPKPPKTLEMLIRIAEVGKVSLDWLLTGKERTSPQKTTRTIQDWCKILFVDMPKQFIMGWDDIRLTQFGNSPYPYAWLDIHIKLATAPVIDYDTGEFNGEWEYAYNHGNIAEYSTEIKRIMSCYGLSDKQKEEACMNVINETIPF